MNWVYKIFGWLCIGIGGLLLLITLIPLLIYFVFSALCSLVGIIPIFIILIPLVIFLFGVFLVEKVKK